MKTIRILLLGLLFSTCTPKDPASETGSSSEQNCDSVYDTVYRNAEETPRFKNPPDSLITWDELCALINRGKIHTDTAGDFESDSSDAYVFPETLRHFIKTTQGFIELTFVDEKLNLSVNGRKTRIWYFDDAEIHKYNLSPAGPVVICSSAQEKYAVFDAGFTMCNGTGCSIRFHFIINLKDNAAYVLSGKGSDMFPLFMCDFNSDQKVDFIYPFFLSRPYKPSILSDTTESLHFIPFNESADRTIKPILKQNGDTVFFQSFCHFEYGFEQPRIWSVPREGQGITFKVNHDY